MADEVDEDPWKPPPTSSHHQRQLLEQQQVKHVLQEDNDEAATVDLLEHEAIAAAAVVEPVSVVGAGSMVTNSALDALSSASASSARLVAASTHPKSLATLEIPDGTWKAEIIFPLREYPDGIDIVQFTSKKFKHERFYFFNKYECNAEGWKLLLSDLKKSALASGNPISGNGGDPRRSIKQLCCKRYKFKASHENCPMNFVIGYEGWDTPTGEFFLTGGCGEYIHRNHERLGPGQIASSAAKASKPPRPSKPLEQAMKPVLRLIDEHPHVLPYAQECMKELHDKVHERVVELEHESKKRKERDETSHDELGEVFDEQSLMKKVATGREDEEDPDLSPRTMDQ